MAPFLRRGARLTGPGSADGGILVTGDPTGIGFGEWDPEVWFDEACERADRPLSEREWKRRMDGAVDFERACADR
ncbi:hypothetical protein HDA32_004167 [Spinactinospora alkalitolerans]|uniref:Uncharacterized protein n=1 Tax=Spinactinospora alkalitolerans TaxID=687207 RepID=A0A852U0H0_9ACTN|nr:hypothetical protein [Spinactinospora alkalitolerans]NYE49047.1 hypothetical protein [Spinactinospora alkalitolerans]